MSIEEAIRQYRHNNSDGFVFGYDMEVIDQLFDQLKAENTSQLAELTAISDALGTREGHSSVSHIEALRGEVVKYRVALEHYADEKFYFPRSVIRLCNEKGIRVAPIYADFGETAEQAIKASE